MGLQDRLLGADGGRRRYLAVFIVLSLAVLIFLAAASEVMEGETLAFDRWILLAMRNTANPAIPAGPTWLRQVMTDITALGGYTVLTLLNVVVVGYLLAIRKAPAALYLAASSISGMAVSTLLKLDYLRPRPTLVAHLVEASSTSFPSGHAMNSAVTYLTLGVMLVGTLESRAVRAYVWTVAICLVMAIGISRVFLGVHWPSDVLAGWSVGSIWVFICSFLFSELRRRGIGVSRHQA